MPIFSWWMFDVAVTVSHEPSLTPPIQPDTTLAQVVGWGITLYIVAFLAFVMWLVQKPEDRFLAELNRRYTIRATIPGYFIFAVVPSIFGMILIGLTGQANWGLWLACLSVPSVILLAVLTLRKGKVS
jgi:hypothetical protein